MSHDFAQKLWRVTKLGVRVIVARHELAPVDFAHPNLFRPKLTPAEPAIANGLTDGRSRTQAVLAQADVADTDSDRTKPRPTGRLWTRPIMGKPPTRRQPNKRVKKGRQAAWRHPSNPSRSRPRRRGATPGTCRMSR